MRLLIFFLSLCLLVACDKDGKELSENDKLGTLGFIFEYEFSDTIPVIKISPTDTLLPVKIVRESNPQLINKTYSFDRYIPIKVPESKDSTHVRPGYHYDVDAELSLTVPANQYEYTVTPLRIYPEHIDRRLYISFDMGYTYTGIRTVHYYLEPMR